MALGRRQRVEAELRADLLGCQGALNVLLVRKHEQRRAGEPLLLQQLLELLVAVLEARAVGGVDDSYQSVGLLEIVAPVRAQRRLPAHVPDVELVAAVLERLDVEAASAR